MIKNLNGYGLTKKVRHKFLFKVCPFSIAKMNWMVDHIKPTIHDDKPDHVILHTGKMNFVVRKQQAKLPDLLLN